MALSGNGMRNLVQQLIALITSLTAAVVGYAILSFLGIYLRTNMGGALIVKTSDALDARQGTTGSHHCQIAGLPKETSPHI